MAQAEVQQDAQADEEVVLEGNTYEIIRNRLNGFGKQLRERLETLNQSRKDVFGSIETVLLNTERITTEHNCVPRDLVAIGNKFLFGYNVHFGLKTETHLADVFAVYDFKDQQFHQESLGLLDDEQFQRDFKEVYRYYKNAVFSKFFMSGPHLYMVFQVGKTVADVKSFKWLIEGEKLIYQGNRSDHEVRFPAQHEYEWKRTHRDLHQEGEHPHISIEDRVFVETVGGDLTIKIENSTNTGEGIYSEPVNDPDQVLDDAEIYYASIGNIIILKIKPYQEQAFRYIVYNEKMQQAQRIDAVEHACVLLPDDHGLIFSNGYYLQTGEHKTFDHQLQDMMFEKRLAAPNGEDYLYVFYNQQTGVYVLLRYNLIEQQVDTPVICHGATFFHAGEMACFRSQEEPQKHHALQVWQTPYVSDEYQPETNTDSFLYKVGNREIVGGMAECFEVLNLIDKEDTYANLYVDLVRKASDILDAYFWLDNESAANLSEVLLGIKDAGASAVDQFDKVVRVKQNTQEQTTLVRKQAEEIISDVTHKRFEHISDFVKSLSDLRRIRGELISLKDLRYLDETLVDSLENGVAENTTRLATRCIEFLLRPDSLSPYQERIEEQSSSIAGLTKVSDARQIEEEITKGAEELEMLIDIVSNLDIDDATHRTQIIDNISGIFSIVNTARAALKNKSKELMSVEGVAEFNSQMKLLNQAVVNYLDICDTPIKCEEFLTKVMIQLEELEGRFAEFDEFVVQLTDKREEIYNAFETRKLSLVEARNKRATALMNAAERILKGIQARIDSLETINDINGYFASDLMIDKVRDIVSQLEELEDSVKVDDIQSRLKTIREDAVRQLKDRQELFVDGENVIKMGSHHFSVNVQALDLTTVLRDNEMQLHLTGTDFFEAIEDERLLATRDVWDQEVVSENKRVYRGEYLAHVLLQHVRSDDEVSEQDLLEMETPQRMEYIQQFMGPRYTEAYAKGVHDHDAEKILQAMLEMNNSIGLLRFHAQARSLGVLYWEHFGDAKFKTLMADRLKGIGEIGQLFPGHTEQAEYIADLQEVLAAFVAEFELFSVDYVSQAARYLYAQLSAGDGFVVSRRAANLYNEFQSHLQQASFENRFTESVKAVSRDPESSFLLVRDWVEAFLVGHNKEDVDRVYADEVAVLLMRDKLDTDQIIDGDVDREVSGMVGDHVNIQGSKYHLNYNEFATRLELFQERTVPDYRSYIDLKKEIVDQARDGLRLEEFRPRVLTSFVRNKLIDSVYLPLIGDNLAKQIGVVGEDKRTDLMGLLLLISPPGYGKTTLMEYVANRLGVIFMKINGPAIGHHVTSLDPDEAPNAGAREEVNKLNLALEMGDNVMIYLDDIQHCNPEFLQKFISLCDAQRKIEGVYKGRSRTYDLRGRKVAVVMAGNPYTESGDKFQIPDMLANRADIYNLGEIIGDSADAFEMSYLENSLTSNSHLNKLASRSQQDVYNIIKMAQNDSREGVELEGNYSIEELNEMVSTMQKLMRIRDVILQVNRQYIDSAAQANEYRTEPAFKLQGSYRNMNRMAEKVVPIMNDDELQSLILTNYENDAQTLTSDTESNLLKLREMLEILTPEEADRWKNMKRTFQQNIKMKGVGSDDKVGQVILQLSSFSDGLLDIRETLSKGVSQLAEAASEEDAAEKTALLTRVGDVKSSIDQLRETLDAGVQQVAGSQDQQAVTTTNSASGGGLSSDAILQLTEELRALTTGAIPVDPDKPTQRVSVMHRVPREILDVLSNQFELMDQWMRPVLENSNQNSSAIKQLQQTLESSLSSYSTLINKLEKAKGRDPKKPSAAKKKAAKSSKKTS
jgi:MoxR-like ATPase